MLIDLKYQLRTWLNNDVKKAEDVNFTKLNSINSKKLDTSPDGVTVILNIWKRNHIEEQIESLLNQTIPPFEIWVLKCGNYVAVDKIKKRYPFLQVIDSAVDFKYFGRFSLAQYANSDYVFIVDDDVIPSPNWIETCRQICRERNAIVASAGRLIPTNDFYPEKLSNLVECFIADVNPSFQYNHCSNETIVDFGCNSWLIKRSWLANFWSIPPQTFDTGEDIHLSASCKITMGVSTVVPAQLDMESTGNTRKWYGQDHLASWKASNFLDKRADVIRYFTAQHNWKPINW